MTATLLAPSAQARLSDAEFAAAVERVAEYDARVARGEQIVNESTLAVAEQLAKLYADGRWFDELAAEREAKPKGRGRPVERSAYAFGRWLRGHHADHLRPTSVMRLMGAHRTVSEFLDRGEVIPTSEYQVRPLYRLTSTGRGNHVPEVWALAVEKAGGGQPTREQVAQAVREWWDEHVPRSQREAESKQAKATRARIKAQDQISQLVGFDAGADLVKLAEYLSDAMRKRKAAKSAAA